MRLPDTVFIRRGVAKSYLGVSEEVFAVLVQAGTVKAVYPKKRKGTRALFYREQIAGLAQEWKTNEGKVKHD